MSLIRDPFEAKKALMASGMDKAQAEAIVQLISVAEYRVVSKEDLKEALETQSKEFRAELKLMTVEFDKKLLRMTITTVAILGSLIGLTSYLQ